MMQRLSLFIGVIMLINVFPSERAHAQISKTNACFTDVYAQMAKEERLYRSVIFGQKSAEDVPIGSVRYDSTGTTWQKTENNSWKSLDPSKEGNSRANVRVDADADVAVRRGILEIKKSATSDLLPSALQSLRALQCRLKAVCELATISRADESEIDEMIPISTDGCMEFSLSVIPSCKDGNILESTVNDCNAAVTSIIARESQLLHLVFTYDAAYRTLLQFSGNFEGFLTDFRTPLLEPLWQTVRALGAIDNIPCFNAQCDR